MHENRDNRIDFDGEDAQLASFMFDRLREENLDPPGVTRASYGDGERRAHALAREVAERAGLEIRTDFAGNLYMTLPGRDRTLPCVMMGSHMDSVPHGGNFDGAAGVVAGLVALVRMRRLCWTPAMDVTVMAVRAEELSWFPSHYIGSRAAWGRLPADALEVIRFDTKRTLADHMAEEGFEPERVRKGEAFLDAARIGAYVELHIEQGPSLVASGHACGVVTAIRGNLRYKHPKVTGQYGHAGAVPRAERKDAVFAAVEFAGALEDYWLECEANGRDLVCTVGQFFTDAHVHTMTKISGEVRFTMDIRSYDDRILMATKARLLEIASGISARRGLEVNLGEPTHAQAAVMDEKLQAILREVAAQQAIDAPDIASGAGHDCAVFAGEGVPCAMIFVRNDHGSHNPDEAMEIADFGQACRLLFGLLERITQ
jgi:N-carbamoyl-L-amino-acid hydrolase